MPTNQNPAKTPPASSPTAAARFPQTFCHINLWCLVSLPPITVFTFLCWSSTCMRLVLHITNLVLLQFQSMRAAQMAEECRFTTHQASHHLECLQSYTHYHQAFVNPIVPIAFITVVLLTQRNGTIGFNALKKLIVQFKDIIIHTF